MAGQLNANGLDTDASGQKKISPLAVGLNKGPTDPERFHSITNKFKQRQEKVVTRDLFQHTASPP
jgi:hypothetical protein